MPVVCPYCDHRINLNAPKPGRYRPRCPACAEPFALVVPPEPGAAAVARPLRPSVVAAAPAPTPPPNPDITHHSGPPAARGDRPLARPPARSIFGDLPTNPDLRKNSPPPGPSRIPGHEDDDADYAPPPPEAVRGFAIERELGRGGMGAVYLARQLSLDRPVALKVMSKRWAADPVFVARFTREAYAAAQLSHPNIVQIHDIGEADGARFFSMEYVRGRSLADLVRDDGKVDPETAVGYVLQAARGLKHAHDRGLVHRDVKPDNLLLDENGLVKVADLGLVKTAAPEPARRDTPPGGFDPAADFAASNPSLTGARIALGTPAYMSPEQCRDAAAVDHRADIYSLGCTLYVLVTGRPPFDGTTAMELMTKHAYEPMVPPEQIAARVPPEVSAVICRMMEKNPDDRFADMGEVVRTLEGWLGVHHAGTFSPRDEQIGRLEGFVAAFNGASAAVLRGRLVQGAAGALVVAAVLLAFFGRIGWASGLVGFGAQAALAYFVLDGVSRRGFLFGRTRQFVRGMSWADGAVGAAGLVLFGLLLAMFKVFWVWVGFGLIGVGVAVAVRFLLDRPAEVERQAALDGCGRLLRRMRGQGLGEDDVRLFVAKFAGRHWEEFFEALFGFDAKLAARAVLLRGGSAGPREKHAAWREPLVGWMERAEKARKEARERKLLAAVEQARLVAAGATAEAARSQAADAAEALVRRASDFRRADAGGPAPDLRALTRSGPHAPFAFDPAPPPPDRLARFVGLFVGPHVRAVAAAVLLAACGLWAHQNGFVTGADLREQAARVVEAQGLTDVTAPAADARRPTRPLKIEDVPEPLTAWADGFHVGFAGLLLLASLFYRGNLMAAFVLLGAAVAAGGHRLGVHPVEPLRAEHVALMLGSVLTLVGFRVGGR